MIFWSLLLFVVGISFSAFFSGSETGFYRATRVRLTMDALTGDRHARRMLWLANNPSIFVATILIGNNIANYITSLAVVLFTHQLISSNAYWVEIFASICVAPIVFIYGELLPKNLFYLAPNRLLRRTTPVLLFFLALFSPAVVVLFVLARGLQTVVGASSEQLRLRLARGELHGVFKEGHDAGVLRPSQRQLAQGMLTIANRHVGQLATPIARLVSVRRGTKTSDVLRLARRQHTPGILVTERDSRKAIGYVRLVDLYLNESDTVDEPRPLPEVKEDASPIAALIQLQDDREMLACVVDSSGTPKGIVTTRDLVEQLLAS